MSDRRDFVKSVLAAVPGVKAIETLTVEPGEVVVLKVTHALSGEEATRLRKQWADICETQRLGKIPVLVLDAGVELTKMRLPQ